MNSSSKTFLLYSYHIIRRRTFPISSVFTQLLSHSWTWISPTNLTAFLPMHFNGFLALHLPPKDLNHSSRAPVVSAVFEYSNQLIPSTTVKQKLQWGLTKYCTGMPLRFPRRPRARLLRIPSPSVCAGIYSRRVYRVQVFMRCGASQPEAAFFNVISVGYRPASYSACQAWALLQSFCGGEGKVVESTFRLVTRLVLGTNDLDLGVQNIFLWMPIYGSKCLFRQIEILFFE